MFISGEKDGLVPPKRISQYMTLYGSALDESLRTNEKHMVVSKKTHVEEREPRVIQSCLDFLQKHIESEKKAVATCFKFLHDMKRYRRSRPATLDFMKMPYAKKPQLTEARPPKTPATFFGQSERRAADSHMRQASAADSRPNKPPFEAPPLHREVRDIFSDHDTPNLQSTETSDDIKQPSKLLAAQPPLTNPLPPQTQSRPARPAFDPYQLKPLPQDQMHFRRSPTESSSIPVGLLRPQKLGSFDKPQTSKPSRSRIFDDDQEEAADNPGIFDPRTPVLHPIVQPQMRLPFQEYEKSQNIGRTEMGKFQSFPHLRQSNHQAPGIGHLDHFSSTVKRPTLNLQNQYSRQPTVEAVNSRFQPPQDNRRASKKEDLQTRFDEEDLSLLLDSHYQIFQDKASMAGENLEDSMVQDLETLNNLLKKTPH